MGKLEKIADIGDDMMGEEPCCPVCTDGEANEHSGGCPEGQHLVDSMSVDIEEATHVCSEGEIHDGDKCVPISVAIDISLEDAQVILEADTGKTIIRITGIAFHEGLNKNGWGVTREGADTIVGSMLDMDLTLNHPRIEGGRFTRNIDGGVDEAIVGYVTEAEVTDIPDGGWVVRFAAEVHRTELFEALESGLWLREDFGVSIGGTGIPEKVVENIADDTTEIWFGGDFTLDHLAIVHKPAYSDARIHTVERVGSEEMKGKIAELATTFNNQSNNGELIREAKNMTDEVIDTQEEEEQTPDYELEIATLREEVQAREAEIDAFKAAEAEKAEAERQTLVDEASERGIEGHDDLTSEVIANLIASWQVSHVEASEMKPVESGYVASPVEIPAGSIPVVANWLNRQMVETPEPLYARCYNSWVQAWNGTLTANEKGDGFRALTYEEIQEMN